MKKRIFKKSVALLLLLTLPFSFMACGTQDGAQQLPGTSNLNLSLKAVADVGALMENVLDMENAADAVAATGSAVEVATGASIVSESAVEPEVRVEEVVETVPEVPATPTYTYTELNKVMYAKSSVNVRDLPSTDGNKLGSLSTNKEVKVTGQCNETGWYRIEFNGATGYVSNNYLSDTKVEVQTTTAAPSTQGSNDSGSGGGASNNSSSNSNFDESDPNIMLHNELIAKCGIGVWNDFGDWMVYVSPVDPLTVVNLEREGVNRVKEETKPGDLDVKINILAGRYPERHATATYSKSLHRFSYQVVVWFVYTQPVPQEIKDFFYKYTEDGRRFPGWFNY